MYKSLFILSLCLSTIMPDVWAQAPIKGKVTEQDPQGAGKPIAFVNVYWLNTQIGTATNFEGAFEISPPSSYPATLVISHVQYTNDTLTFQVRPDQPILVSLRKSTDLEVVEKVGRKQSTNMSTISTMGTQYINSSELKKAPCCNLSESFETNASVDVVYSDAVSGAKKIQMLGLDGIYSQIMFENIPLIRGMASAYGLAFVPGPWIESISVNKGTGSVLNGYESISGQINLEYFKPSETDHYFINLFGSHQGRLELNGYFTAPKGKKWSSMTLVHAHNTSMKVDGNDDGFLDAPLSSQINLINRWTYHGTNREMKVGGQFMDWHSVGGQTTYDPEHLPGTPNGFGVDINIRQYALFAKNGFLFPSKPEISLGLIASARRTEQESLFGLSKYNGLHDQVYFNSIFQYQPTHHHHHLFKAGISHQWDGYEEDFEGQQPSRDEWVTGAFGEWSWNDSTRFSVITGLRGDYNNLFGWLVTPRIHANYKPTELTAIRLSLGKGFRSAHVYMENPVVFTSGRKVVVPSTPELEEAWSAGLSLQHKFTFLGRNASLGADYYYTYFINQVVIDLDQHPQMVFFRNLDGQSFSHSMQADFTFEPFPLTELRLAARRYNVQVTTGGQLQDKALTPKNRMMVHSSWHDTREIWQVDMTLNIFGSSRIPSTQSNPLPYRRVNRSPGYATLSAQVTKEFKWLEAYAGMENITNFKQPDPIIAADDPFGPYFDGSLIWGPLNGRYAYAGIRKTFN
ncbi:MAG: TonB-dependent receptor [Flavobacteriales bacterium]|nr:TonB-dependent receptor [Flavobacteriales bacterium]